MLVPKSIRIFSQSISDSSPGKIYSKSLDLATLSFKELYLSTSF